MRLIFFGSSSFAVASLRKLHESRHRPAAVVTQPDRPRSRSPRTPVPPPVKEAALALGLDVLQPERLEEASFLDRIRILQPEAAAVAAYGRLLPAELLKLFPRGAYNLHASLLPKYRGAAPIAWALIHGERQTGVTIFRLDEAMDHGQILLQARHPIRPEDDAETLTESLSRLGADRLARALDQVEEGQAVFTPQDHAAATRAPALRKEDGRIDWSRSAEELHNRVRGLQPWPGAFCTFREGILQIRKSRPEPAAGIAARGNHRAVVPPPGTVVEADASTGALRVQTGRGILRIEALQPAGKRVLSAAEFLRGRRLTPGTDRFDSHTA